LGTLLKLFGTLLKLLGTLQKLLGTLQKLLVTLQKLLGTLHKLLGTLQKLLGTLRKMLGTFNGGRWSEFGGNFAVSFNLESSNKQSINNELVPQNQNQNSIQNKDLWPIL